MRQGSQGRSGQMTRIQLYGPLSIAFPTCLENTCVLHRTHRLRVDLSIRQDQAVALALVSITGHGGTQLLPCLRDQELMQSIGSYNEVDCRAMAEILHYLRTHR